MPSLICSSRYTLDSQILRKAAQRLGWETLRLDGDRIPDWFDPPDDEIAFFYTAPHVFDIAGQLGRTMLGCNPDWTINLPPVFLRRDLRQTTLADAMDKVDGHFVKHAVSKAFPASVYSAETLAKATSSVGPASLVHIGEPVNWINEYRCFVRNQTVTAISPYVCDGTAVPDYDSFPQMSGSELSTVRSFAESVLSHPEVDSPNAFVLDVGQIDDRGWAVVEFNECWASGIYGCDPSLVLQTLLSANVPTSTMECRKWDFEHHYWAACPKSAG